MTRIICSKFFPAAILVAALACLAVSTAYADEYSPCDKVKHGQSGQTYAWKKDC